MITSTMIKLTRNIIMSTCDKYDFVNMQIDHVACEHNYAAQSHIRKFAC